jgi:hypothetical protein
MSYVWSELRATYDTVTEFSRVGGIVRHHLNMYTANNVFTRTKSLGS